MKNVFILCVVLFSFGCKKYDEGGISLRSKTNRIKGNWKMNAYEVGGRNGGELSFSSGLSCKSGQYLNYKIDVKLLYDLEIKEDGIMYFVINSNMDLINDSLSSINCEIVKEKTNQKTIISNCSWGFENDKEKLKLIIFENDQYNTTQTYLFDIIKLSNTELKLRGNPNTDFTGAKINTNMYLSFIKE